MKARFKDTFEIAITLDSDNMKSICDDIARSLMDDYPPLSLEESICHMLEEYLKKKGWI